MNYFLKDLDVSLSSLIAITGVILCIIFIYIHRSNSISIKLLGSLLVLSLTFAANNEVVYGLSILIVATLVTDLDFLEKIAALFWNRDKYWDYRITKGSSEINKQKIELDAKDEISFQTFNKTDTNTDEKSIDEYISNAVSFEKSVHSAIKTLSKEDSIFYNSKISFNSILQAEKMKEIEIDAIIETSEVDFIVEIKYSKRPHIILNSYSSLKQKELIYTHYLRTKSPTKQVVIVLIIPATIETASLHRDMTILKFDQKTNNFVNLQNFKRAVSDVTL